MNIQVILNCRWRYFWCSTRLARLASFLWHAEHSKSLVPLCEWMCAMSVDFKRNALWHIWHLNGLMLLWMRKWRTRSRGFLNRFGQLVHKSHRVEPSILKRTLYWSGAPSLARSTTVVQLTRSSSAGSCASDNPLRLSAFWRISSRSLTSSITSLRPTMVRFWSFFIIRIYKVFINCFFFLIKLLFCIPKSW